MNILQESYDFLQERLLPHLLKRHHKLFRFGFEALTLRSFVSLNSNARITVENRSTAESKIYRLVSHGVFLEYFPVLVNALNLVSSKDIVNVDFSTFCGFHVLTFAKQTYQGRALPLYVAILRYPVLKGSQTQFVMNHIKQVVSLLGFSPTFVFDRGFESPYMIPFLFKEKIPFVVRVKAGKHVKYEGKSLPLYNFAWSERDCMVGVYQNKMNDTLRIVISEKNKRHKEPWYLLTNILIEKRETITSWYYFRFEIEETFKDVKHIFELKKFYHIRKQQTFQILLWFIIVGIWMAFLLETVHQYLMVRTREKRKKKLSVIRYLCESIQLELFSIAKKQFL